MLANKRYVFRAKRNDATFTIYRCYGVIKAFEAGDGIESNWIVLRAELIL